jgi:hypothetical protein
MTEPKTSWTVTLEEADDGSGDIVLPFPQDFLDLQGWAEGDTLEWIDNEDGSWSIQKATDEKSSNNG